MQYLLGLLIGESIVFIERLFLLIGDELLLPSKKELSYNLIELCIEEKNIIKNIKKEKIFIKKIMCTRLN